VARAVIDLKEDIIPVLPQLCRIIKGCAFNLDEHIAGFNYQGMPVVIHKNEIVIHMASSEATADEFILWLRNILSNEESHSL